MTLLEVAHALLLLTLTKHRLRDGQVVRRVDTRGLHVLNCFTELLGGSGTKLLCKTIDDVGEVERLLASERHELLKLIELGHLVLLWWMWYDPILNRK